MNLSNNLNTGHASMTHNENETDNLSGSSSMLEQNSKSTLQPKLHERLVHILAIGRLTKDNLYARIMKDGLTDSDESDINNCLKDIAIFKDNVYNLRYYIWNDVDEDWPHYTEEEREVVRLNKIYNAASMLLNSSSGSDSTDIGISLSRDFEEPQLQTAKVQRLNEPENQVGVSTEANQNATHARDETKTAGDQLLADISKSVANGEQEQEPAGQPFLYQQPNVANNHRPMKNHKPQTSDTDFVSKKHRVMKPTCSAPQPEGCYVACTGKNPVAHSSQVINNPLWYQLSEENANDVLNSKDNVGAQGAYYLNNKTSAPFPNSMNFNEKPVSEQIHLQPHAHLIDTTDLSTFPEVSQLQKEQSLAQLMYLINSKQLDLSKIGEYQQTEHPTAYQLLVKHKPHISTSLPVFYGNEHPPISTEMQRWQYRVKFHQIENVYRRLHTHNKNLTNTHWSLIEQFKSSQFFSEERTELFARCHYSYRTIYSDEELRKRALLDYWHVVRIHLLQRVLEYENPVLAVKLISQLQKESALKQERLRFQSFNVNIFITPNFVESFFAPNNTIISGELDLSSSSDDDSGILTQQ